MFNTNPSDYHFASLHTRTLECQVQPKIRPKQRNDAVSNPPEDASQQELKTCLDETVHGAVILQQCLNCTLGLSKEDIQPMVIELRLENCNDTCRSRAKPEAQANSRKHAFCNMFVKAVQSEVESFTDKAYMANKGNVSCLHIRRVLCKLEQDTSQCKGTPEDGRGCESLLGTAKPTIN